MAKYIPIEQYTWVWHPFYGVFTEVGYMRHREIERLHPEIHHLPVYEDEAEILYDYNAPRGYMTVCRIDNTLTYVRYDQSKYAIRGTKDKANAQEVDAVVRKNHGLPKNFTRVLYQPEWWN